MEDSAIELGTMNGHTLPLMKMHTYFVIFIGNCYCIYPSCLWI